MVWLGALFIISQFQELLSLAKRKRVDAGEQDEPVNKPAASTDSETSDSDDEVKFRSLINHIIKITVGWSYMSWTEPLPSSVQWTVGGTKGKKKVKQGKGYEKKNATKKKVNKATASGSSDGDSSAESSAPEEGEYPASELRPSRISQVSFGRYFDGREYSPWCYMDECFM